MSTPFRFGLQRVRDIRAHDEEQAKERFAHSLSQRLRGEAMLRAAEDQLRSAQDERPADVSAVGEPVTGAALVSRQAWVDRLKRLRDDAAVQLRGLDGELQASRDSLTHASRRREVLDQLEARQREAHRRDAERREGAELDEMALRVHARGRAA
jgi:flagellar FliJ protein